MILSVRLCSSFVRLRWTPSVAKQSFPLRSQFSRKCSSTWKVPFCVTFQRCTVSNGTESPGKPSGMKMTFRVSKKQKPSTTNVRLIGAVRAMNDYILKAEDLAQLPKQVRRSPFIGEPPCIMYLESDVLALAIQVHGSVDALHKAQMTQRKRNNERQLAHSFGVDPNLMKSFRSAERRTLSDAKTNFLYRNKTVLAAVLINSLNTSLKFFLWLHTGSHSLFAEVIHSMADTLNQLVLVFGIYHSVRQPDTMHPYGYSNARYVASLISGVGIFCFGTGISVYHGVQGILQPGQLENFLWAVPLLGISFVTEGATFLMALLELKRKAARDGITFTRYVLNSEDPTLTVVFLEDLAAVVGVGVAAICLMLSVKLQMSLPDAVGSLIIGSLLGIVASFIIKANANHLVGRSISPKEIESIVRGLEEDIMIRSIQDVKATKLGTDQVRFKAEIDFNGRNITRSYLETLDMPKLLEDVRKIESEDQLQHFLLNHGEQIIDRLGAEIDRIEQELKQKFPDLRHVDLEVL